MAMPMRLRKKTRRCRQFFFGFFFRSIIMASGGGEWPDWLRAKAIVLDFDKTITNRHTRGAVFQHSGLDEVFSNINTPPQKFLVLFMCRLGRLRGAFRRAPKPAMLWS
jgi:hypothetical protein